MPDSFILWNMQIAGLIFDDSRHYLDHLAPFCALLGCPLIFCEPELAEIATRFYPDLSIQYVPIWEIKLPKFTITCDTTPILKAGFPNQSTQILWLPHGNSDKGWNGPYFESLQGEIALVYGQRMIDFMSEKGVFPKIIRVGNFRYAYYSKHLKKDKLHEKNFLYAPTWDDLENNNSFWTAFPLLAKQIPKDCNLWIKLHPNTIRQYGPQIEQIIGQYMAQPNIHFLPDEPPIYPLLAKCAGYIGDMSSIGYDFLTFNRPMYFLNAKSFLPLHKCGLNLDPKNFDFSLDNSYSQIQKTLYQYTFDAQTNWKEEIDALCSV